MICSKCGLEKPRHRAGSRKCQDCTNAYAAQRIRMQVSTKPKERKKYAPDPRDPAVKLFRKEAKKRGFNIGRAA